MGLRYTSPPKHYTRRNKKKIFLFLPYYKRKTMTEHHWMAWVFKHGQWWQTWPDEYWCFRDLIDNMRCIAPQSLSKPQVLLSHNKRFTERKTVFFMSKQWGNHCLTSRRILTPTTEENTLQYFNLSNDCSGKSNYACMQTLREGYRNSLSKSHQTQSGKLSSFIKVNSGIVVVYFKCY